ncbi:MAG: hypothetical protein K2N73_14465 [Lachnospiraceae bacterium]|nr:hypothetical protein [Lachnospiraceae bacterium]
MTSKPVFEVFPGVVGCGLDVGGVTVSTGEVGVDGVCAGGACDEEASCPGVSMIVDESVLELSGLDASEDAASVEELPCVASGLDGGVAGLSGAGAPVGALSVWAASSAAKADEGVVANNSAADIYRSIFADNLFTNSFLLIKIFFM